MSLCCMQCKERYPGCHDKCIEYQAYNIKNIINRRKRHIKTCTYITAKRDKKRSNVFSTHKK